jgi:hypothetical protein
MPSDRDLFLHEFIDINGMHQWDYMEHTLRQSGDEKVEFELLGTWYTMGITARWPQVVNVWEIPGGWDGWYGKVDRLGLKRATNATLNAWWKQAFEYRAGGFDRLLGAVPGCPNIGSLTRDGVRGSLFVHELTEVRPGTALEYLAAVREERAPLLAEYGHTLVGLYEVLMNDYEVCTIWATDADAHVRAGKARDVARGLASETDTPADPRFEAWHERARTWAVRWREELMTPHVGSLCAPIEAPLDDSATPTDERRSQ